MRRKVSNLACSLAMLIGITMREIQSKNVYSSGDQSFHSFFFIARRPQRCDNFCTSFHGYDAPVGLASSSALSSMRLENPHSLSYQAMTLTSEPLTRVCEASKLHE